MALNGETLTDEAGRVYGRADEIMELATENWASALHGGNDMLTEDFLMRGNDVREDGNRMYIVEGNPGDLYYSSFSSRQRHFYTFRLKHGGSVELRDANITSDYNRLSTEVPVIDVEGDEPLTITLHGANKMYTRGEYGIRAKGGVKLKGNGNVLIVLRNHKGYGISTVKSEEDVRQLAADGYEVSYSTEGGQPLYTVRPKATVAIADVRAEHVGFVIAADGKVYPTRQAAIDNRVEPLAMIAYVGHGADYAHGLAVALEYTDKDTWPVSEVQKHIDAFAKAHPIAGCTWRLPTKQEVVRMMDGCAGFNGEAQAVERGSFQADNYNAAMIYARGAKYDFPDFFITSEEGAEPGSREAYSTFVSKFLKPASPKASRYFAACLAF